MKINCIVSIEDWVNQWSIKHTKLGGWAIYNQAAL